MEEVNLLEESIETDVPSPSSQVEPHELLKSLDSMLGVDGDIKGIDEVDQLLSLMQDSAKLVSRCVFVNILKATKNNEILERVIAGSGWDTLNTWLQDAKGDDNVPFITELLKVYAQLPVRVDILKRNSCAKTIKQLGKLEDDTIKTLSSEIVDNWMAKIKSKPSGEPSSDKSKKSKKKHHHHHHHHHHHRGDKPSPSGSPASSPRHNGENEAESLEDGENRSRRHHSSSSSTSSISSSSKSSREKSSSRSSPTSGFKEPPNASNTDDRKSKTRPRTVKTVGSKLRSTGNLTWPFDQASAAKAPCVLPLSRDIWDIWNVIAMTTRMPVVALSA